ncbi:MAG: signal peptidase I [Lachnospiraceae bacterium]|nr:signal peptidase I [Lachnospiraceae bacterium]
MTNSNEDDFEVVDLSNEAKEIDANDDYYRAPRGKKKEKDSKEQEEGKEPVNVKREILSYVIYIGLAIVLTFVILTFVGQRMVVQGPSMENTLFNNESVIVDKISYRFSDPKRFDIIVFPYKHAKDTNYIKRIIGLPGEKVRIDGEGTIYINGEVLPESYGREKIKKAGRAEEEITLGDDEYFVLGDNRNNSSDSREPSVGNIKRSDIIGRAFIICWPLERFSVIKHQ